MTRLLFIFAIALAALTNSPAAFADNDEDIAAIEACVALNQNEATVKSVEESGFYDSYKVYRKGYDIIIEFRYVESVDLSDVQESISSRMKQQSVPPLRKLYNSDATAMKAINAMKAHRGAIHYIYTDHRGNRISFAVKASEI